jgi:hypothetical protein
MAPKASSTKAGKRGGPAPEDVEGLLASLDPGALLQWLARDRASATFRDLDDVEARRSAFAHIIRQWIAYV